MSVAKCPNCGASVVEGGKFCAFCGGALPDDTQHIAVEGTIEHNVTIRRERANRTKIAKTEAQTEQARLATQLELEREKRRLEQARAREERRKREDKIMPFVVLAMFAGLILMMYFIIKG